MVQNTNTTQYLYRADGVKLRKTYTLVNNLGTKVISTEYLDGFQYSTPNTEPIRSALEEQDDVTISATRAGNEEAFLPPEERPIAPGNPPAATMILSFFPRCAKSPDFEQIHLTLTRIKNHYHRCAKSPDFEPTRWRGFAIRAPIVVIRRAPAAQSLLTLSKSISLSHA